MPEKYASINKIRVRSQGGDKRRGILQAGRLRLPCALGYSGVSAFKREGDLATPRAKMHIMGGFCKSRQNLLPRCGIKLRRIRANDGWCDAPADANYNRLIRRPCKSSAEALSRADNLYNIGFVLDWNTKPRIKGRGSAVFLHIARSKTQIAEEEQQAHQTRRIHKNPLYNSHATSLFHPTAGCIALPESSMRRLMPFLRKGTEVEVLS